MTRDEIAASVLSAGPGPDDLVFVARRGDDYAFSTVANDAPLPAPAMPGTGEAPEAWMYFTGRWPLDRPEALDAFLEEMLAEMESMNGGADRCRWPLDQPWPLDAPFIQGH